jgi:hypothetical protein
VLDHPLLGDERRHHPGSEPLEADARAPRRRGAKSNPCVRGDFSSRGLRERFEGFPRAPFGWLLLCCGAYFHHGCATNAPAETRRRAQGAHHHHQASRVRAAGARCDDCGDDHGGANRPRVRALPDGLWVQRSVLRDGRQQACPKTSATCLACSTRAKWSTCWWADWRSPRTLSPASRRTWTCGCARRSRMRAGCMRRSGAVDGVEVPVLSLQDLLANKLSAGRPQDLVDAETLRALLKQPR